MVYQDVPTHTAALAARYPDHVGAARMYGDEYHQDIAGFHRRLRARYGAVAPVLMESDIPAWLVLGYREVHYVLTQPDLFNRDGSRWNALDLIPPDWSQMWVLGDRNVLLQASGDDHARRSAVLHDALAAVDPFDLRARTERVADELIDDFASRGDADLVQFAQQLAARVLSWMIGFPMSRMAQVVADVRSVVDYGDDGPEAHQRLLGALGRLADERRERPAPDIASRVVKHPLAPEADKIRNDLMVLMTAGQQPMGHWISNALRLLLADPRFAVSLQGGRRSVGQAMAEVLWEDSPAATMAAWWAARATQLGNARVQAGDLTLLGITAAHADPLVRPDQALGAGGNQAHLAFSHGPHRCPFPAQELSETIAETALEVLLDRLPDMTLAVAPDELRWQDSAWIRGLVSLPVVFTPV